MRYHRGWPLLAAAAMMLMACPKPDSKPDKAPVCGNKGQYEACRTDLGESACLGASGEWGQWGMAPVKSCRCPTADAGCACSRAGDCEGACLAPIGAGEGDRGTCEGLTQGTCSSVRPVFGCHCFFNEDGKASGICID